MLRWSIARYASLAAIHAAWLIESRRFWLYRRWRSTGPSGKTALAIIRLPIDQSVRITADSGDGGTGSRQTRRLTCSGCAVAYRAALGQAPPTAMTVKGSSWVPAA